MKNDIAEFEAQILKLCKFWKPKMTHAELVGVLDTVKMMYHIKTIQAFEEPEIEVPLNIRPPERRNSGSPLPANVKLAGVPK